MNEVLNMAVESIRVNKIRSFLTVLGVVIGVTTVIGMSSVVSGLNSSIIGTIEGLGSNLIFLSRLDPVASGRRSPEELARKNFTLGDAEALADLPDVRSVTASLRARGTDAAYTLRYQGRTVSGTIVEGVTPDHEDVYNLELRSGRWINENDDRHRSNVLVIGYDAAEILFPNVDTAVGRQIEVEGRAFQVIGVLEQRATGFNAGANPEDNLVELPISTFGKLHPEIDDYQITLQPLDLESLPRALDQIEGTLRLRRGVRYNEPNNFVIFTQDMFTELWGQISGGIFAVMLSISSVGLLVGGVGVMNIMLVSVTERTREIGIRKAIGATRSKIMGQFLFEAMTLTSFGGILGLLAGFALTFGIRTAVPFLPASVSPLWAMLGFATSVGTGLVFGLYPAYKAALLDPIEALRHE